MIPGFFKRLSLYIRILNYGLYIINKVTLNFILFKALLDLRESSPPVPSFHKCH